MFVLSNVAVECLRILLCGPSFAMGWVKGGGGESERYGRVIGPVRPPRFPAVFAGRSLKYPTVHYYISQIIHGFKCITQGRFNVKNIMK